MPVKVQSWRSLSSCLYNFGVGDASAKEPWVGVVGISNRYVWNIIDLAKSNNRRVLLVANQKVPDAVGIEEYENLESVQDKVRTISFFTGVVRPESKRFVVSQAESCGLRFPDQLTSRLASLACGVELGGGVVIRQMVVVDPFAVVGDHVTLSPGVTVGHHTSIGAFSHLANGVTVSGGVSIGEGVFVGVGAAIRDGVTVGHGATVGMGAVVTKDVEPGATVIGNLAEAIR